MKNLSPSLFIALITLILLFNSCSDDSSIAPTINQQILFIAEDANPGTIVGTIEASDADGDVLTFSIESEEFNEIFSLDNSSGEITLTDTLDFETKIRYIFTVQVDDGENMSSASITINVLDVIENSAPEVVANYTFAIPENSAIGTSVGTVEAFDADEDDLVFSISAGNELEAFEINANSGEITVALSDSLDYETNPTFELMVSVDDGEDSGTGSVTIYLTDVNINEITLDGSTYNLIDGVIYDYDNINPINLSDEELTTHHNYFFIIVDDELTFDSDGDPVADDAEVAINMELYSPGTTFFKTGNYTIKDLDGLTEEDIADDYLLDYFDLFFPHSDDKEYSYKATSGTIIVTENSNLDYTLNFDLEIQKVNTDSEEPIGPSQTLEFSFTDKFYFWD